MSIDLSRLTEFLRRSESGQLIILSLMMFTVVFVIGFIIVDVGIWVSERRGASKDADATALAGAQAFAADLTDITGAFDEAVLWAQLNGVDPAEIDGVPTLNCSAGKSCIGVGTSGCRDSSDNMPWVEAKIRHPDSAALFSSIFGFVAPDIGASARACVGSPRGAKELSPFGVQTGYAPTVGDPEEGDECSNEDDDDGDGEVNDGCPLSTCLEPDPTDPSKTRPVFGSVCILKLGAQGSVGGQRGQLTIGNAECDQTSSNTLRHDFHYGAGALCEVGKEVNTGTGNIIGLLQGLNDRLLDEGLCDQLFGTGNAGYDDFNEVFSVVGAGPADPIVPSADNVFSQNDCRITVDDGEHVHNYMPRAIDLVLIDQLEQGDQVATITGFAGFYVIGCFDDSIAIQIKQQIEQNLNDVGPYLNRCDNPTGQDDILGIFVKELKAPLIVGDPDPNLGLAIVLVE
jgi:hypothetical protein